MGRLNSISWSAVVCVYVLYRKLEMFARKTLSQVPKCMQTFPFKINIFLSRSHRQWYDSVRVFCFIDTSHFVSSVQPSLCSGSAQLSTHSQSFPQVPLNCARDMESSCQAFPLLWLCNGHFNLLATATVPFSVCFLPFQVVLLRMVGVVFPTSDLKHPITTPAMLLMGQMLLKVRWLMHSFSIPPSLPLSLSPELSEVLPWSGDGSVAVWDSDWSKVMYHG